MAIKTYVGRTFTFHDERGLREELEKTLKQGLDDLSGKFRQDVPYTNYDHYGYDHSVEIPQAGQAR